MRQTPYLYIALAVLATFFLTSCRPSGKTPSEQKILAVSVEPVRYLVEQLAGPEWNVLTMVPKGGSPETYEPTSQQLVSLSSCEAYLRVGPLPFEENWLKRFEENAPDMVVVDLSEGLPLLHSNHEGHGEMDPHWWMSPGCMLQAAPRITETLCQLDSAHTSDYRTRLEEFVSQTRTLDSLVRETLKPISGRCFAVYHPSLSYFANDYDLCQLALEEEGKEPTTAHLRKLVDTCRKQKIPTILIQEEFAQHGARLLAEEVGAKVVVINPLAYSWPEELLRLAQIIAGNKQQVKT